MFGIPVGVLLNAEEAASGRKESSVGEEQLKTEFIWAQYHTFDVNEFVWQNAYIKTATVGRSVQRTNFTLTKLPYLFLYISRRCEVVRGMSVKSWARVLPKEGPRRKECRMLSGSIDL